MNLDSVPKSSPKSHAGVSCPPFSKLLLKVKENPKQIHELLPSTEEPILHYMTS